MPLATSNAGMLGTVKSQRAVTLLMLFVDLLWGGHGPGVLSGVVGLLCETDSLPAELPGVLMG